MSIEILKEALNGNKPSYNFLRLKDDGSLNNLLPELCDLEKINSGAEGKHKNNFKHTLEVLDNVALNNGSTALRFVALFHDLGKAKVKKYHPVRGWTFDGHQYMSVTLAKKILARFNYTEDVDLILNIVELHHHPLNLYKEDVTDAALRRLKKNCISLEDLLFFCEQDITTKSEEKAKRYKTHLEKLRIRFIELEKSDRVKEYQPPLKGKEIMERFGLPPSEFIGVIKDSLKEAILNGDIREEESLNFVKDFIKNNKNGKIKSI